MVCILGHVHRGAAGQTGNPTPKSCRRWVDGSGCPTRLVASTSPVLSEHVRVLCGVKRWGRKLELGWLMSVSQMRTAPRVSMQAVPSHSNTLRPTYAIHVIGV